jgi:hypothetical protein
MAPQHSSITFFLTIKLIFNNGQKMTKERAMKHLTQQPKASGDARTDVDLDDLNDRIDRAIARFDQMRRDYRFLANPQPPSRRG